MVSPDQIKVKFSAYKCNDCGYSGRKPACVDTGGRTGHFGCAICLSENIENIDPDLIKVTPKKLIKKRKSKRIK